MKAPHRIEIDAEADLSELEQVGLDQVTISMLRRGGMETVGQVSQMLRDKTLKQVRGIGPARISAVSTALRKVLIQGKIGPSGWNTSDLDEIQRRVQRAREQGFIIEQGNPGAFFGGFLVGRKESPLKREVELRSLTERLNTCTCEDFQVNGLGTCKHIEAVLLHLSSRRGFKAAANRGPDSSQVFLSRETEPPRVRWESSASEPSELTRTLAPFFADDRTLLGPPEDALPSLRRSLAGLDPKISGRLRISSEITTWLEDQKLIRARREACESFLRDVNAGKRSVHPPRGRLFPYQVDGALHLAFQQRALLADEMGLGKTIQAIAAAEILARLGLVQRVLVVTPVSLKTEWEEQIEKFSGRSTQMIFGLKPARMESYRHPTFYNLANYEQIRSDHELINTILMPDLVILDEAQRIKNWQTVTARHVKLLRSPYAFVLTGTPLENRIDELYSILQFLDPHILGPLFRFNREFYQLDERGLPVGYKNLDKLYRRVQGVMLRRRKADVEEQLPERTIKTVMVNMAPSQLDQYKVYEAKVAQLLMKGRARFLTKEEMALIQQWLGCMRMLCDTPFILDRQDKTCPKLAELAPIIEQVISTPGSKAIIFSEWERMLQLVSELLDSMSVGYARHTGKLSQQERREQINRFKQDPDCHVFLSTDSGATGLNLQIADTVINLDLPWNPARLEQRIARAWRKNQTRNVRVVHLVARDSIELKMLGTLEHKQRLSDGVLDGMGELKTLDLQGGRSAFIKRIEEIFGAETAGPEQPHPGKQQLEPPAPPQVRVKQDLTARLGDKLVSLLLKGSPEEPTALLVVLDDAPGILEPGIRAAIEQSYGPETAGRTEILDRDTWQLLNRLAHKGLITMDPGALTTLHPKDPAAEEDESRRRKAWLTKARERFSQAERFWKMATLLSQGGFPLEALDPAGKALTLVLASSLLARTGEDRKPTPEALEQHLVTPGLLQQSDTVLLEKMRNPQDLEEEDASALLEQAGKLRETIRASLEL